MGTDQFVFGIGMQIALLLLKLCASVQNMF